ncbi:GNAT family N-acetyltransferase [Saccharibacillus qingshengii]|uniref:GNAT family N-acetyltransferase n=1 Tax=Saccharibacillus qingshengii TaxID=1763540 RepID=UPI0015580394|nr:GNAT family N-acetyltransferase [Saccharibacillus qingshengii]
MRKQELQIDTEILKTIRMDYLLYAPSNDGEETGHKWPLILYLHGAGGSGSQLDQLRKEGLPARLETESEFPFIVVAPQCPLGAFWNTREDEVLAILNEVTENWNVDPDRVYLTGFSMGAYGVWQLAAHHRERFAAIAPVSGGGDPAYARKLADMPTWIFHGEDDKVIRPTESEKIAEAMRTAGAEVELTLYPGMGHDCWRKVYANDALYRWFMEHSAVRKSEPASESSPSGEMRSGADIRFSETGEDSGLPDPESDSRIVRPSREDGPAALGLYSDGTERLRIERVREGDAEELLRLEQDNQSFFRRFAGTRDDSFYTLEKQEERVRRAVDAAALDQLYLFVVRERQTEEMIGIVDLTGVSRGSLQSAWIGYFLDLKANGQGYMTEAVRFVVRHAFEVLALHRIEAGVMPHNEPSIRVLEKAGFAREGLSRRNVKIDGRWRDHVLLAILNPKDMAQEESESSGGAEDIHP